MSSSVTNLFRRWLQHLEKQGKTGQYELAALIPDPPGSAIFTVGDLRELVKILNVHERVNMSANDRQVAGKHYSKPIQHWDFVLANDIPYMEAQIIRYVVRWRERDGITDLEKCRHYLDKLIEHEKEKGKKPSNERPYNPAYCPHGNINIPPEFICTKCQSSEEVIIDEEPTSISDILNPYRCHHGEIHRPPAWICSYCLKEEMDAATKASETTGEIRCRLGAEVRGVQVLSDPDFGIPTRFGGETVSGYTNFPPPDLAKGRDKSTEANAQKESAVQDEHGMPYK